MPDSHKPPLWYDEFGTAHFDVLAAAQLQRREEQQWNAAMQDMQRMGMAEDAPRNLKVPRAQVFPESNVPPGWGPNPSTMSAQPGAPAKPGQAGIGDIHSSVTEPGQKYWNRRQQPRALMMPSTPVARRAPKPKVPKELEGQQFLIENVLGPEMVSSLEKFRKCGPFYMQPMTWLAPPVTAICVDVFTGAEGVKLPGVYPPPPTDADCPDVLSINVPDRWIFVLTEFGNELEDHLAFGDVQMSMQRNGFPIRCYGNFDVQLGRFVKPTGFPSPIILKHKDKFRLKARSLSAAQHFIFARIRGWAWAVNAISGGGQYSEFCVE